MTIARIYQAVPLSQGATITLDERASHHLMRVLRAGMGDQVTLFNGEGGEYSATITEIGKKKMNVSVHTRIDREAESPIQLHLAQGIARGEKMDFIIQKAVELGVSAITPLITERCNVRLDREREEKRTQHWQSVIISACEQSGRNRLPTLSSPQSLSQWLPSVKATQRFVLSPHATEKLSAVTAAPQSIVILIGPEGGLSPAEIEASLQQGFSSLNLGPRILRTETASIAALSVLQSEFGDLR